MPEPSGGNKISTKAAGIVGLAVMCSRILGLVREQVFAALFEKRLLDIFVVAFRTPNLLRDLFAEGALSTAFVTVFSKKLTIEGDQAAWRLASKVATLTVVFMSVIALFGVLAAPLIIKVVAPLFDPEKAALTVWVARIMYPFILLVSLAALVMGMLNARNVFAAPAMASSFFNLGSIIGGVGLGWWLDPSFGPRALTGLALGTLIGGALQLAVQLPSLKRVGFVFRPDFQWRDEGVREILRLMGPAIVASSSVQVNVVVNTMFASGLGDGPIFWLQIAFRLLQLPLGIFGVAIMTVTLPVLARNIAAGSLDDFRGNLAKGMRLACLLTLPSTIGLILLAEPIVSVLYQHGKFGADQASQAAGALRFYAIGLIAYSAMKVLVPAFYALGKRRTPMYVSFVAIGTNLLLNWVFTFELGLGHRGLALSTGCVALINFAILYVLMRRETRLLETGQLIWTFAKLLLPCALLAGICVAANLWLFPDWPHQPFLPKTLWLVATISAAGAAYFGAAALFRIPEIDDVKVAVQRRLQRATRKV